MADKRIKKQPDAQAAQALRETFYAQAAAGELTAGQAVAAMRKISRLTQPEFARHRGISVQALRQIEKDAGNPTVETLNKVAAVFGLQVGFVPVRREALNSRDSNMGVGNGT